MLPTVTPVIHELIIVRDEDSMKTVDAAEVEADTATGASVESALTIDPHEENLLGAGVPAVRETGSVTARSRDMRRREDEDATAPLCPHRLINVNEGPLTLLPTRNPDRPREPSPKPPKKPPRLPPLQQAGTRRWVAIHKDTRHVLFGSFLSPPNSYSCSCFRLALLNKEQPQLTFCSLYLRTEEPLS